MKEKKLKQFWQLYRYIKNKRHKVKDLDFIFQRSHIVFDEMCRPTEISKELDKSLGKLARLKDGLLLGLDFLQVPLHNNQSESDIREFVIRRIISGPTKSMDGLLCRDTFASLIKDSSATSNFFLVASGRPNI